MKKKFNVEGMTCAACQAHVEKAVSSLTGIDNVSVNLLKNTMDVSFNEDKCSIKNIEDAVKNAGYNAFISDEMKVVKDKNHSLRDLIISVVFLILLMYFSMGVMMWNFKTLPIFDMDESKMGFSLIQFILVLPILYINRGYFIRGYKRLFKGPSMDSLIAVGATASMAYSIYALFSIAYDPSDAKMLHMSLYFEAAGMILVFVSLGKYLENLSKKKTTKSLEALYDLAPKSAIILKDDKEVIILAKDVKVGDILVVKKGNQVPVDGIIIEGNASIDQSNITGESIPVYKSMNDEVYASTISISGFIIIKATKVNEDTSFSKILKLVEEASSSKAPISKLADKISSIFVPLIFIISIIVFFANFLYIKFGSPDYTSDAFGIAFNYTITVIVIACPCALGLATPVAIMVSTGKGASLGLIIKNASILERTGKISTIVFDKTGTITNGKPSVTDITISDKDLSYIVSLEALSSHPLAFAIIEYGNKKNLLKHEVYDYKAVDGMGIYGSMDEDIYYIGNKNGIKDLTKDYSALENEGKTVLYISKNEKFIGIIAVRDEVKKNSKEAIAILKDMNINLVMLTGDNDITAKAIANSIGITNVIANVLPNEKADVIKNLKKDGKLISMVGDGVNDAPALAVSDLAIAIGAGSDIAKENSDIVLVRNDLFDVVNAIRLSKRTLFTIKLGLFWAFFYNLICVFLASGILYHITKGGFQMKPEYGSIAMSISSVSVVLNALSINFFKLKRNKDFNEDIKIEEKEDIKMASVVIGVEGMMCKHCKAHVEEACKKVLGVTDAVASLEDKNVKVDFNGDISIDELKNSIKEAGYEVK